MWRSYCAPEGEGDGGLVAPLREKQGKSRCAPEGKGGGNLVAPVR